MSARDRLTDKHYLLFVLTIINVFNYLDRMVLSIVLQDVKGEFSLSDTQLGLMTGPAFAVFYSLMGLPLARWADRGDRVLIVTVTLTLWSVAVALCGAAQSFEQLMLIRVAVAVGEAGCLPTAFSLLADYFSREERARATAIYGLGGPLSMVLGFFLAGWANDAFGWRMSFVMLALPGLLLAPVAWFTLAEPRRWRSSVPSITTRELSARSMISTCRHLWSIVSFRWLVLCQCMVGLFLYGLFQWLPTFYIRTYGFTASQVGMAMALTIGIGALAGTYVSGEAASRLAPKDEGLQLRFVAGTLVIASVASLLSLATTNVGLSLALLAIFGFSSTALSGPLSAAIQTVTPDTSRATAFAILYLASNLIGIGLGPLLVGATSDLLAASIGEASLRVALLALTPGFVIAAALAWGASRSIGNDLPEGSRSEVAQRASLR